MVTAAFQWVLATSRRSIAHGDSTHRALLVLVLGLAWGSSVVFTRLGVREIPPLSLASMRLALSAVAFAVALWLLRRPLPQGRRVRWDIAMVGITATGFPLAAFTFALLYLSSGMLSLIISLVPLATAAMAQMWLADERMSPTRLAGLTVALMGVILLLATGTSGLASIGLDWRGPALALSGVLVAAASAVYTRRRLLGVDAIVVAGGQSAVAALAVIPLAIIFSRFELTAVTWVGWAVVGYTGLIGSFLAFVIYFHIIREFGATTGALATYIMPVASAVLGVIVLAEVITLPMAAGAGLVLSGVFLGSR